MMRVACLVLVCVAMTRATVWGVEDNLRAKMLYYGDIRHDR